MGTVPGYMSTARSGCGPRPARGCEAWWRADSWATDAHKWLNVPYNSGLVFCAQPDAHRAAMGIRAIYLMHSADGQRDALDYNPEHSRRARGFAVYAAIRALGRSGIAQMVERCCAMARRFAEQLAAADGVEVLNEVVLNQVLGTDQSGDRARAVFEPVHRRDACQQHLDEAERPIPGGRRAPRQRARALDPAR